MSEGRDPGRAGEAASPAPLPTPDDPYRVALPSFEGPLDLLLHLIQQHELDVLDIPVAFITERYLAMLSMMQHLAIDVASEYLVMAATLAHIKSRMLLPTPPPEALDEEGEGDELDPRAELVRRLLEYQKFKDAAAELGGRAALGRDVFARGAPSPALERADELAPVGVFKLLEAFEKLLERRSISLEHEVAFDRISITDRIVELSDLLGARRRIAFEELFSEHATRYDLVITFLALLEMCRLRMIDLYQSDALAPIHVALSVAEGETGTSESAGEAAGAGTGGDAPAAGKDRVQQEPSHGEDEHG